MGPILIFDKSFLQSLSQDESVWLDMFFFTNITPLFFIETLADLEKEAQKGLTPEKVVGNLATKTPDMCAVSNVHHQKILERELLSGATVDMISGRAQVQGGANTQLDGQKGIVFEQSPEEKALARWQSREFHELEWEQARTWRSAILLDSHKNEQPMFPGWYGDKHPENLENVKKEVDIYIDKENQKSVLMFGLSLLDVHPDTQTKVIQRWVEVGSPPLREFLPYFSYIYSIELFFYLARSADLISQRPTNKVDITYLYYLPFCMVFTSQDKLHRATVPLFMRSDQSFIWGPELKKDLAHLDEYYSALPEKIKAKGLHHFASQPPHDRKFLTTQLWDRHMRPDWRECNSSAETSKNEDSDADIISKMRRATEDSKTNSASFDEDSDEMDFIITKHYVSKRKGKWNRFLREMDKANDDFDGPK